MKLRRRKCILSCASHQRVDEDEPYWDGKKRVKESAWLHNSAHVISQLAQCFTNAMVGPRAWVGGFFSRTNNRRFGSEEYLNYTLTSSQEERLHRLRERLGVPYDETRIDHQETLRALWDAAFPNVKLKGLISEQWKDMGWQGSNPSTDFRGCGFLSLENLLFFAQTYPVWSIAYSFSRENNLYDSDMRRFFTNTKHLKATFNRLLLKQAGDRAEWEYPFAVAGINVTFMLIQMLDLHSERPRSLCGFRFLELLGDNENAFDILYCIAFAMMDVQWLAMHASYMEFKEVLQVTRTQLERELSLEDIHSVQALPAYKMLCISSYK